MLSWLKTAVARYFHCPRVTSWVVVTVRVPCWKKSPFPLDFNVNHLEEVTPRVGLGHSSVRSQGADLQRAGSHRTITLGHLLSRDQKATYSNSVIFAYETL